MAYLDVITTGKGQETIDAITNYMVSLLNPLSFDSSDPNNMISQIDRNFVTACQSMKKAGISNPEQMTVFEWEVAIDNFEKEFRDKNKQS